VRAPVWWPGARATPEGLTRGYYVKPTVFADVTSSMRIAREEIFGPVLAMIPFEDEDGAVRYSERQ
jgi:acyl-CoA reductase-like NAD-dependent aldehyde dehydrogenase